MDPDKDFDDIQRAQDFGGNVIDPTPENEPTATVISSDAMSEWNGVHLKQATIEQILAELNHRGLKYHVTFSHRGDE